MRIQEILSSTPRSSLVRFPGPTSPQVNAKTKLLRVISDEDGAPNFRMPRRRWLLFRGWWEAPGRTRPPFAGELSLYFIMKAGQAMEVPGCIYHYSRWLTEKKMDLGGPLSGLCHWFAVNPQKTLQKTLHRPGIEDLHLNRITNEIPSRAAEGQVKTDLMISSHLHESTSISIIMILATVLFILLITAFVTCITRKKRRPQVRS